MKFNKYIASNMKGAKELREQTDKDLANIFANQSK